MLSRRPSDFIHQLREFQEFGIISDRTIESAKTISEDFRPSYNVAPTALIPTLHVDDSDAVFDMFTWGLIPPWAKDEKMAYKTFNARSETMAEKPSFRSAFKHSRCVVPIDGYYEWQILSNKTKQPNFIHDKGSDGLFLAGLYEPKTKSVTIVTKEAEGKLRELHTRRPIPLDGPGISTWLDPLSQADELFLTLDSSHIENIAFYPVSTEVNAVRNNRKELLDEVAIES